MKPNFWSLTPVVTAAWPWMSTSGVTLHQYPLRPSHLAGQIGDFHERVDYDAADADVGGIAEFVERFRVAVHDDARRVDPRPPTRSPVRLPELTSMPAPASVPSGRRRCTTATLRHRRFRRRAGRSGSAAAGCGSRLRRAHRRGCGTRRRSRSTARHPRRAGRGHRRRPSTARFADLSGARRPDGATADGPAVSYRHGAPGFGLRELP